MIWSLVTRLVVELYALDPRPATRLACRLERYTDCAEVLSILSIESKGRRVGVHTEHHDRVEGYVFWRAAVDKGLLNFGRCEHHQPTDGGYGWGPRGVHGLVAAYSVYLLGDCVSANVVDVPFWSAVITIRRLRILARRYGFDRDQRARAWQVGVGAVKRGAA